MRSRFLRLFTQGGHVRDTPPPVVAKRELPRPPIHITSDQFKYTPSHSTDVRVTFKRARKRLEGQSES